MKAMGGTSAIAAALPALFKSSSAEAAPAPDLALAAAAGQRGYVAGKFALDLDGAAAGWIQSVEGGCATADVVTEKIGPDHLQRKHIANIKYEDITFTCGTGMSKGMYQWIKDAFDNKQIPIKQGVIVGSYPSTREVSRLTFGNAFLAEITLPALDAASKDAAKMTIKVTPETTQYQAHVPDTGPAPSQNQKQKAWLTSNFRLKIDGLDCSRVNKIEALTIKQRITTDEVDGTRQDAVGIDYLEIPNLVITLPELAADSIYKWHEDFVIKGNNSLDYEKTGTLEYLAADQKTQLFAIELSGLGIVKVCPEKQEAGSEGIRRVKFEMYCESMAFSYQGGTA